jgi:hypothetical protein
MARTRLRMSGWTPGYSRSERDTVPGEIFNAVAIARMVGRRLGRDMNSNYGVE